MVDLLQTIQFFHLAIVLMFAKHDCPIFGGGIFCLFKACTKECILNTDTFPV